MTRPSWDQYHIEECYSVSRRSRDLSTRAGAVIVDKTNTPLSRGYNSLPRGIDFEGEIGSDGLPSRLSPIDGAKYLWTEHAERNAIYNAARVGTPLVGATLYVNWLTCIDCARAINQVGIDKVIVHAPGHEAFLHSRGENFNRWDTKGTVQELFAEADVELVWFDGHLTTNFETLFSGKIYKYNKDLGVFIS